MTKISRTMITLVLALALGFGCAPKPGLPPVSPPPVQPPPAPKVDLVSVLMAEAQKFADQKNYKDALLAYNQALAQAGPKGQPRVLAAIEELLAKTPAKTLEAFLDIPNLTLPAALIQYYIGLNLATSKDYGPAAKALNRFIETYPDHAYIGEAKALLAAVQKSAFNRETIGCLLPMSGKYELYGQRSLKGIQMAVQDLSLAHGRNFRVIVKDTQSDPDLAAQAVEDLAQENVLGIVGPLLAPEAAGKKAEELKIPLIALTQKSDFPLQGEYLFSNFITPEMQVQTLGAYIFGDLGLKQVAILYPREKYGQTYMELFWNVVEEFHGEVVGVEPYDGNETDFSAPLKKLTGGQYPIPAFLKDQILGRPESQAPGTTEAPAEEDPQESTSLSSRGSALPNSDRRSMGFQALFIPDSPSRINMILPQLVFHDVRDVVLLGTNLWHQDSLLAQTKGYNKNTVIADGYFGESSNPATADFHQRFQALYGETPGFLEAIAYDTAKILFSAALPEEVNSRADVRAMLQRPQFFDGATGKTLFDKSGSPHKELFLITIKGDRFMEIRR